MPVLPEGQSAGQALGDLFGGVNRPQLNAFVATSQARNGLVSAQTQDAMIKASQAQEEMEARGRLKQNMILKGAPESDAQLATDALIGAHDGSAVNALKVLNMVDLKYGNPDQQVRASQSEEGKLVTPPTVSGNYLPVPGSTGAFAGGTVQQTPGEVAKTGLENANAGLITHRDIAPGDFRNPSVFGVVSPEGQAALTKAAAERRIDPTRLNSRTAPIVAQMLLADPALDMNRIHADATLQANATFQQRAMSVDMLPGVLNHLTMLGKKLNGGAGYSDLRTVGKMQQFMNGELNDPDYAEFMPVRNDALLRLATVMRGVGMSDQAHTAEIEAMAPTLAPYALDAWAKGQMSVITPMLERQNRITHMGEPGQGTPKLGAAPAATAAPAPAGPAPLGSTLPDVGGPPTAAGPPAGIPSYANENAALAAGHKKGDRVQIGGVTGTLQ